MRLWLERRVDQKRRWVIKYGAVIETKLNEMYEFSRPRIIIWC